MIVPNTPNAIQIDQPNHHHDPLICGLDAGGIYSVRCPGCLAEKVDAKADAEPSGPYPMHHVTLDHKSLPSRLGTMPVTLSPSLVRQLLSTIRVYAKEFNELFGDIFKADIETITRNHVERIMAEELASAIEYVLHERKLV